MPVYSDQVNDIDGNSVPMRSDHPEKPPITTTTTGMRTKRHKNGQERGQIETDI
ncbi:hypothetical protein CHS0354_015128 [Potamilus streckersoni]|uniref:Uncharacterized protein n=1 Tax=Potamilus streckersoni TaxID=2493646 RepID=A0AAE0VTN2_9BIVA|nr:hypothetical protein CHS0354_015128 [Potamilus streckersoni]